MAGTEKDGPPAPFALKIAADSSFEGRKVDVFAGLDALEQKHMVHQQNRTDSDEYANLNCDDTDDLIDSLEKNKSSIARQKKRARDDYEHSGQDSSRQADPDRRNHDTGPDNRPSHTRDGQFRRPRGMAPGRNMGRRGNRVSDHSENWTYYNLDDVKGSDMSEKSNTQAALAFLDERRKARELEEMEGEDEPAFDAEAAACSKGLISFAKRNKTKPDEGKPSDKAKSSSMTEDQAVLDKAPLSEMPEECLESEDIAVGDIDKDSSSSVSDFSSGDSTATIAKPSFKNRKGIKRSIRSRDEDD